MTWFVPPGLYTLRDETRSELRSALPFPESWLEDPDHWGRGLSPVAEQGPRRLWRFNSGAMMWTTVSGGDITDIAFLTGEAAVDTWAREGSEPPPDLRAAVSSALAVDRDLDEALDALFGRERAHRTSLLEDRDGELLFAVTSTVPFRRAFLGVRTRSAGTIRSAGFLDGVEGYRRFEALMRRRGAWT